MFLCIVLDDVFLVLVFVFLVKKLSILCRKWLMMVIIVKVVSNIWRVWDFFVVEVMIFF